MFVEFAGRKVRVQLNSREMAAVLGLIATCVGYVLRTELRMQDMQSELVACHDAMQRMILPQGVSYTLHNLRGETK